MASARGTKRPSDRSMEKCECCRIKRVKCLPTTRDWSKGEKCYQCENRDQDCGPNTRARKPPRKAAPNIRPTDRVLAPSPPSATIPVPQPSVRDDSILHEMPVSNDCQLVPGISGSFESQSSQTLTPQTPEQASSTHKALGENDPIASSFIRLGDLRMTLQNTGDRLRSTSTNIPRGYRSSSDGNAETVLEFIASCLKDRYSTEIQHLLSLVEASEGRAEHVLRRALDDVGQFLAIVQTPTSSAPDPCNAVTKSKVKILNKLVSISKEKEDFPEVERFLKILAGLSSSASVSIDPDVHSQLAESYTRTSQRMQHILDDLSIPPKYRNWLHLQGNGPFPPIHRALLDQNRLVAQQLYNKTRQFNNEVDILRRQPLHVVAETSNLELLNLVRSDAYSRLEAPDLCRRTPLCVAAYVGNLPLFEQLFSAGADVGRRDEEGRSVLCVACAAGRLPIVQFLLENKVSPNDGCFGDCLPLQTAASAGHLDICRALLEAGAYTNTYMRRSPYQIAMDAGHCDVANLIEKFSERPENLFLPSVDGPALDETSFYPPISQPDAPVQHVGDVPSSARIQCTPSERRFGTISAEDIEGSYEIIDSGY